MSAPRLHFVVPGPLDQRTGGYLYDARMVRGLRARGWKVTVHELPGRFPDPDAEARRALTGTLEELPDGALVVADGLALGLQPEAAEAVSERLRLLALVHHPLSEETGLSEKERARFRETEARTLAACAGAVVTSGFTAERLQEYGLSGAAIRTVVPGTGSAPPARGPGRGQPPRLLCVGSVTRRKGHDVLVSALERIADREWSCVFAGSLERDPDFAAAVERQVEEAGLTDRIELLGEVDRKELAPLYRSATLFVLASWYEGYGMALTEALARGLPVVSTTGGAIPWTVPEETGVLVPPGDPEALAGAVAELLDDADRRSEMGEAARAHVRSLPGWGQAASNFSRALRSLVPEEVA